MFASTVIKVAIERSFDEVYEYLVEPRNFPEWAAAPHSTIEPASEGEWLVELANGPMLMRFTPRNDFGVVDYQVYPPGGTPRPAVPCRLIRNDGGCELMLVRLQMPGVSDEQFRSDVEWIESDLQRVKALLEAR